MPWEMKDEAMLHLPGHSDPDRSLGVGDEGSA